LPAIKLLAELHHQDERWAALIAVYQRQLLLLSDNAERAALLLKMGEVCELGLGDLEQAAQHYRKATQADPSDLQAARALRRVLTETGQWKELVQLLDHDTKRTRDRSEA